MPSPRDGKLFQSCCHWGALPVSHLHPIAAQVERQSLVHLPDEAGWRAAMQPLHDALAPFALAADACSQGMDSLAAGAVDVAAAREEFELGGQEGLDELLAALGAGGEAVASGAGADADPEDGRQGSRA